MVVEGFVAAVLAPAAFFAVGLVEGAAAADFAFEVLVCLAAAVAAVLIGSDFAATSFAAGFVAGLALVAGALDVVLFGAAFCGGSAFAGVLAGAFAGEGLTAFAATALAAVFADGDLAAADLAALVSLVLADLGFAASTGFAVFTGRARCIAALIGSALLPVLLLAFAIYFLPLYRRTR